MSFILARRCYAAGARQGSSIANVKMVRYGRFQIPVRLLKRWLEKQERTRAASSSEQNTAGAAANAVHAARSDASKRVSFADVAAAPRAADVAGLIEERWATLGPAKRSWLSALLHSAREPGDWPLLADAWLRFAEPMRVADSLGYARLLLLAAVRCDAASAFVDLLRADGLVRLPLSASAAKLLLYAVPPDRLALTLAALLHRQPLLMQSRKVLVTALLRAEEPGAADAAEPVAQLLRDLPQGDAKPALTAAALLRVRLAAQGAAAADAVAADALKLDSLDGRAIAALATLVAHAADADAGVPRATALWANASTDVAVLAAQFGRRVAYYPAAKAGVTQFLGANADAVLAAGQQWHAQRRERVLKLAAATTASAE